MRVTVVGSSDAFNSLGRNHSSYLVEGDGVGPLMVDFGGTSLAALRRLGRSPLDLAGVAITHLHGDHVGGFAFLVIDGMFNEVRRTPLPVVGPVLTAERLDRVVRTAYGAILDHHRPLEMPITELMPGQSAEIAGVLVEAFAADHMDPPDVPLCLRLSAGGKSVAFSGDTRPCEGLFAAAEGADLLIAECTALAPPCGRHCSWEDWRAMLATGGPRRIGAKRIVLTHLGRDVRGKVDALRAEFPDVDLAFAEDGMVLDP